METKTVFEIMTEQTEPYDDRDFRRGYHHAVVEVLDLLCEPNTGLSERMQSRLHAWEKVVEEWRYNNPDNEMPEPPRIPVIGPVPVHEV